MKQEKIGFSPEKEEVFLRRLPGDVRRVNLDQEIKTQLAEDFGMVQFTLKYKFNNNGKIVDLLSGLEVVELTSRGGVEEETNSIKKIEEGLKKYPEKTFIHFSPKNKTEKFDYPENCVDFWRVVDNKIVWNRMVIKNDFNEMNEIRSLLIGEEKVKDEMEILKSPIGIKMKLVDIFDLFRLKEVINQVDFKQIEEVVSDYLNKFETEFGSGLTNNSELIFRLYSACFKALKISKSKGIVDFRSIDLDKYMHGIMIGSKNEQSFGCSVTTTIGEFGEKVGYYISSDGQVHYGEIPKDFKECKKCGCWYTGEKCPFC